MAVETPDETEDSAPSSAELAAAPGADSFAPIVDALLGGRDPGLAPGAIVGGEYRIARRIGVGGMGAVYLARDLQLDRDVAIKIGLALTDAALRRLRREALALARLSHPNVVVVHEVGEVGGRVFLAMEHVAGGDARAWIAAAPRTWREIVALYAAAGDGLAAAHAAGLVHRDFKPDNVLVGADGRPRVADFGLAVDAAEVGEPAAAGTPAYMAPEQLAGDDVDARADQFAFCAALWEALFGARPFSGRTPTEVGASIAAGPPRAQPSPSPSRGRGAPAHVIAALRRGLRADRDERWPAMAALLAELRRDPFARRRRIAIAGAAAAAIAAAAIVPAILRSGAADPCAHADAPIARVWNPGTADGVRAALGRARPTPIVGAVDAWARRWAVQSRTVCEAAWSSDMHDRGVRCLDARADRLAAALEVIGSGDPEAAAHAADLVRALPDPASCASPAYLADAVPPPDRPELARAVAAIDHIAVRADAIGATGRDRFVIALTTPLVAAATANGYGASIARVRIARGTSRHIVGDLDGGFADLREAYVAAVAGHDDDDAVHAAAAASALLVDRARPDDADTWARLADALATRLGPDDAVRGIALGALAGAREAAGDRDGALAAASQALAIARRGADSLAISDAVLTRADLELDRGDPALALADVDEALRRLIAAVGPDDPTLDQAYELRGLALGKLGRHDEAIASLRRAVEIDEAVQPASSSHLGNALNDLGGALDEAGREADALPILDRALAIETAALGAQSIDVAMIENDRALALRGLGRTDDAIAAWRRAIAIARAALADDDPLIAKMLANLGDALRAAHRADAEAPLRESLAMWDRIDPDDPSIAFTLQALALVLAASPHADVPAAQDLLERALALRQRDDIDPVVRADTEAALAGLLAHRDPARARALAVHARDAYRAAGKTPDVDLDGLIAALDQK